MYLDRMIYGFFILKIEWNVLNKSENILFSEANKAIYSVYTMVIRIFEFSCGGTKLERFLPKNQRTQRKLLKCNNWFNGELLKIGHHFSNKVI